MKVLARSYLVSQEIATEQILKRRRMFEPEDMKLPGLLFKPPLWRQRRELVRKILNQKQPDSILDLGCGEGPLISFLIPTSDFPLVRIVGVEPNLAHIKATAERCQPMKMDFQYLRENPLVVELYQEPLEVVNENLIGINTIVCIEVIEHLYPSALAKFPMVTLGIYRPRTMIISTPNAEFNVNFPNLKYGTAASVFRDNDHKFEWTRTEFEEWCKSIAQQYGYHVIFTGVGTLNNDLAHGYCTQIAIFTATHYTPFPTRMNLTGKVQEPFGFFEFPYYQNAIGSDEEIVQEALGEFQYVSSDICLGEASPPYRLDLEIFWRSLRIRQLCKTKSKLREVFTRSENFEIESQDRVLVLKSLNPTLYNTEPGVELQITSNNLGPQKDMMNYHDNVDWKSVSTIHGETWS